MFYPQSSFMSAKPIYPTKLAILVVFILCTLASFSVFSENKNSPKKYLVAPTANILPNNANLDQAFTNWKKAYKTKYAKKYKLNRKILSYLDKAKLNKKVIQLDKNQAEFVLDFWTYYNNSVSKERIKKGKYQLLFLPKTFYGAEKKYGIPRQIIASFWGLETNYGSYKGSNLVVDALATLAFEGRRERFFTQELTSALQLIQKNKLKGEQLKGSWAGAIGNFQFMPSNYLQYGYDASGNGKVDLINETKDAIYSAGNFLKRLGWRGNQPWSVEVVLPKKFNFKLLQKEYSFAQWLNFGLKLAQTDKTIDGKLQAKLLLPFGASGPAFLVFHNFKIIKKWNNSNLYALAVGGLADLLAGGKSLTAKPPKNYRRLKTSEIKAAQNKLKQLGYYRGKADGILGANSRQAIIKFQQSKRLITDGFLDYQLLKKMNITQ